MVQGKFIARLNRFAAHVSVNGKTETVHIPNSGRLRELFIPGVEALLLPSSNPDRITRYTLKAIMYGDIWVYVDSAAANSTIEDALMNGRIKAFTEFKELKREVVYKGSRFDFFISGKIEKGCYLEVKSVTLVKDGIAMFPDAPTERGRKHLLELIDAVKIGFRAAVIFCIQRPDADFFMPYDENDPAFGQALRKAKVAGVEVYAYRCIVIRGIPVLDDEVEVILSDRPPSFFKSRER